MSSFILILLVWLFTGTAAADGGDDFSNNLFTDLAPLLALFGERVTMQFMSQSMGWADHIILAMAPLGILTAVVGAIRVGGPSKLKAIIGRARENLAVAELELMSSTSKDVCELWNGKEIVRCMGSSPVIEFIVLIPKGMEEKVREPGTCPNIVVETLDQALSNGHLKKLSSDQCNGSGSGRTSPAPDGSDAEQGHASDPPGSSDIIVTRNTSNYSPNMSLNCHSDSSRMEIWAIAIIGIVLQLGALVFFACINYHPTLQLKFLKNGERVARYAFPCTLTGSVVMAIGMMLCSHVVESSTSSKSQPVSFKVKIQDGKWRANSDQIEAALSLWLFAANQEPSKSVSDSKGQSSLERDPEDDSWMRDKGSSIKPFLCLLGRESVALHRDLWWWMPKQEPILVIKRVDEPDRAGTSDDLHMSDERIAGAAFDLIGEGGTTLFESTDLLRPNFNFKLSREHCSSRAFATMKHISLEWVFAQEMLSAFAWKAAEKAFQPLSGTTTLQMAPTVGDDTSEIASFKNEAISKLALKIQDTGVGTLEEVYLSIIPALSQNGKLPQPEAIIQLARDRAKRYETTGHWKQAARCYLQLLVRTRTYPPQSAISIKATAVAMQFWRQVVFVFETERSELNGLKKAAEELWKALEEDNLTTVAEIKALYGIQGRGWEDDVPHIDLSLSQTVRDRLNICSEHLRLAERQNSPITLRPDMSPDILGWTPFYYVAAMGQPYEVPKFASVNINVGDLRGWTPLHYVCQRGEISMLKALLLLGVEVNVLSREKISPLHCAVAQGHVDVVKRLVEEGAAANIQDVFGNSPLFWAAAREHVEIFQYLYPRTSSSSLNLHFRDILHHAALYGAEEIVRLIGENHDTEAKDRNGNTPLHLAAREGHYDTVTTLLALGASINVWNYKGMSPLLLAAQRGHTLALKKLLEGGAAVNAKTSRGQVPLTYSIRARKMDAVKFLLEHGADPTIKDFSGATPLHIAASTGQNNIIRLLLANEADINAKDNLRDTPLSKAFDARQDETIRLLLRNGAEMPEGR